MLVSAFEDRQCRSDGPHNNALRPGLCLAHEMEWTVVYEPIGPLESVNARNCLTEKRTLWDGHCRLALIYLGS